MSLTTEVQALTVATTSLLTAVQQAKGQLDTGVEEATQARDEAVAAAEGLAALGAEVEGLQGALVFTQAGTGAVARTMQDKMRDVVSVNDFGAVGDGATDDTAAIQAALNSAKQIHFGGSEKIYLVNATLTISSSNISLFGGATITLAENANCNIMSIMGNVSNVDICGLVFDGNGANQSGGASSEAINGITLGNNVDSMTFTECVIRNCGNQNAASNNINTEATYGKGSGIVRLSGGAVNATNIKFVRCKFEGLHAGIAIRGSGRDLLVDSCRFDRCGMNSVLTRTGMSNVVVKNCIDNNTRGMECWSDGAKLVNNKITNSHRHGISGGVTNAYIAGNEIIGSFAGSLYAIEIGLSNNCRVVNNRIDGWIGTSVITATDEANSASRCVIEGNVITNCVTTNGGITHTNPQTGHVISNNVLFNNNSASLSLRGDRHVINGNIIYDSASSLADSIIGTGINIPVSENGGHTICNNIVWLAGPWIEGGFRYALLGDMRNSVISSNVIHGGRQSIYIAAAGTLIQNNRLVNAYRILRFTDEGVGAVFRNNITQFTNSISEGVVTGFGIRSKNESQGTAPPSTGTWNQGDIFWNTAPVSGGVPGWMCVAGGTPGTWRAMAALAVV
jgi:hypothetical protein